jgi:long-chain acyl-CoA synthetase
MLLGWQSLVIVLIQSEQLSSAVVSRVIPTPSDSLTCLLGPIESSYLTPARVALSVPLVNSHTHPLAAGPLFATYPSDLQTFPTPSQGTTDPFAHIAHVGSPSTNVEAKLAGIDDESVENGTDPVGVLMVRGPSIGRVLGVGEASYVEVPSSSDGGWVGTGEKAKILANGAFKILAGRK